MTEERVNEEELLWLEEHWPIWSDERGNAGMRLLAEVREARERIASLFSAIEHGDEAHRKWLKEKIDTHFGVKP